MDLHDIWQENKRWILGVLIGLVVFWIGRSVLQSRYDTTAEERKIAGHRRYVQEEERFTQAALDAARAESEALKSVQEKLGGALLFKPTEDFLLEGKGDPSLHFDKVNRDVRARLLGQADQAGVELAAKDLQWPAAVGPPEIQETLVGLCLMQQTMDRLIAAHERVRNGNDEALGLVAIESMKIAAKTGGGNRVRKRGQTDDSGVDETALDFRLRADAAVVEQFLEACRNDAERPISVRAFKMQIGSAPGEPITVQGTLTAVQVGAS